MPIPTKLKEAFESKRFWIDYLLNREEEPKWPSLGRRCNAEIPVGGGYFLVIELMRFLYWTNLSLRCPERRRPLWMGRDDLANWPREVLRWPEAELFSRAAARLDQDLTHPGLVLVLLYRFTPLTVSDNRKAVWSLMREAFGSLGVLSARAVERCLREGTSDLRDGFAWHEGKQGWVLKQEASNSFDFPRAPKSKFPFQQFAAALRAAERSLVH